MVNDARTAAGADDGADYLAAVEALCSLGERTERELAGAADYGRGELREAASRRRSREQEWERLERRAAQAERTARSLAHAHDVGVDVLGGFAQGRVLIGNYDDAVVRSRITLRPYESLSIITGA